ncbi:hypothetical protein F7Q99_26925 [Streptomyces kaniharaensis]|uniref:Uncharacterized protein n=1 Tax=Streptomyces kaniharaensis TaxID=212423 RepID=A0A6N7KWH3_9ACTN|nr:hypothetical protein [Streptomyces kaniharaensis]MQS15801.1 hypothetical protein [Streptomyces kaniharaensis]
MFTSPHARVTLTVVTAVLLTAGATATAAPAPGLRDVTAQQCRDAGGTVEGSGYCVGADGDDEWGEPLDGQAVNPDPNLWERQ